MLSDANRYVYAIDDEHGVPCYIGAGKNNRLHVHAYYARINKPKSKLIKQLIEWRTRGFEPLPYKVAEDLTIDQALAYEKTLVAWYGRRDLGTGTLLNAYAGGGGGKGHAPSTIARLSEMTKRQMAKPEQRFKRRRGFKLPDAQKAALLKGFLAAWPGSKHSDETKAKISAAHSTAEARALKSMVHLGRKVSAETRAKRSASLRARSAEASIAQRARRERERRDRATLPCPTVE